MKKKIKDLTLKEAKALCEKHLNQYANGIYRCNECPYSTCYDCKLVYNNLDDYGEEEVDV